MGQDRLCCVQSSKTTVQLKETPFKTLFNACPLATHHYLQSHPVYRRELSLVGRKSDYLRRRNTSVIIIIMPIRLRRSAVLKSSVHRLSIFRSLSPVRSPSGDLVSSSNHVLVQLHHQPFSTFTLEHVYK